LVIGASTGFGLASRIEAAFGAGASTLAVYYEKPPQPGRTASPGWYNSAAFAKAAAAEGLYAASINGDAFSDDVKQQTIDIIREDLGQVDLVVYSIASPVRKHPVTGIAHRSVLKPIGAPFTNKSLDFHTGTVSEVTIEPAVEGDIVNTVAVMGGEDWEMWIDALSAAGVLADGAVTVAYSYIGPELTTPVYRKGTIGKAKDHIEATALMLSAKYGNKLKAYVSVNKALVTQASAAIPIVPLYISLLYRIMKEKGIHEGCIEQIERLFSDRLYKGGDVEVDDRDRIRIDDWEMRADVQSDIAARWKEVNTDTLPMLGDIKGYRTDFLKLFGFGHFSVDYTAPVDEMVDITDLVKRELMMA
jgi:enoyl-[acyl-carrier protein] reductase/trans-2-enoyl-CoA reductase (NAD+)